MSRHLRNFGWNVTIVTARENPRAHDYDGLVYFVKAVSFPLLFRIVTIWNSLAFLRRNSTSGDIVLMNEDSLWLVPFIRMLGYRHIHLDIRTVPVKRPGMKRWFDRWLFWKTPLLLFANRVDSYSFITSPLKDAVLAEFPIRSQPFCIWQSGVNTKLFHPGSSRKYSGDNDLFELFYHGGLLLTRGIDLVFQAIAITEFPFKLRFTVVGTGADHAALQDMAKQLGIHDRVFFRGFVPYEDVVEEIVKADCCICPLPDLPEWRVSSPLKVLEYLACEKPLILTPLAAHKEAVENVGSIIWTDDYSPASFGKSIISAWQRRTEDQAVLSAGRRHVTDNFEWEIQAQKLHNMMASKVARMERPA